MKKNRKSNLNLEEIIAKVEVEAEEKERKKAHEHSSSQDFIHNAQDFIHKQSRSFHDETFRWSLQKTSPEQAIRKIASLDLMCCEGAAHDPETCLTAAKGPQSGYNELPTMEYKANLF